VASFAPHINIPLRARGRRGQRLDLL